MFILLSISFKGIIMGAQRNGLNEMVLLCTQNICFSLEIRELILLHVYSDNH